MNTYPSLFRNLDDFFLPIRSTAEQDRPVRQTSEGDKSIVEIDIPGVPKENVEISVQDRTLRVSWTRRPRDSSQEKNYRSFSLRNDVDIEGITATCQDGLLRITIPSRKTETRRIPVLGPPTE